MANTTRIMNQADEAGFRAARVLDLGTGSGCVAIAVAARLPGARVIAVDASAGALAVAKKNAAAANVAERVRFRQGDWFGGCRDGEVFDVVVSNPPYLVEGDKGIWPEVAQYDPHAALYGGRDGLDCYRRIIPDAPDWLAPEGWLFLEVGAGQAGRVSEMLRRRGFRGVGVVQDYGGVERMVRAMTPER
jgi:release factor glutamine methyltransferase